MAAPDKTKSDKTDAAKDESVTPDAAATSSATEETKPQESAAVPEAGPETLKTETPEAETPKAETEAPEDAAPEKADEADPLEGRKEGLAEEDAFGSDDVVASEQNDAERKDEVAPVTETPDAEPAEPAATVVEKTIVEKRGGFAPLLAGGVVAAVIGAAVALWILPQLPENVQAKFFPPPPAPEAPDTSAIEAQVSDLSSQLSTLGQSVSALQDNIASLGQAGDTSGLQDQLNALQAKLDGLTGPDAAAAEEAERKARARAAIAQIRAALTNGTPIAEPVAQARDAALDVPEALGVEPQSAKALQQAFPAAARDALEAARRANAGDNLGARLETFLLTQTGARSVAPKEGTGPDAILSRAQGAVDTGDFKAAINEISTLPEAAQGAVSAWVDQAQKRVAAEEAVASLASQVQ